jgi:hypothetical protein
MFYSSLRISAGVPKEIFYPARAAFRQALEGMSATDPDLQELARRFEAHAGTEQANSRTQAAFLELARNVRALAQMGSITEPISRESHDIEELTRAENARISWQTKFLLSTLLADIHPTIDLSPDQCREVRRAIIAVLQGLIVNTGACEKYVDREALAHQLDGAAFSTTDPKAASTLYEVSRALHNAR